MGNKTVDATGCITSFCDRPYEN